MIDSLIFKCYKSIILKFLMQIFIHLFILSIKSRSESMRSNIQVSGNPKNIIEIRTIIGQLINNTKEKLLSAEKTSSDISHHIVVENGKITYLLEILIKIKNENVLGKKKFEETIKNVIFDALKANEITTKGLNKENIMVMEDKAINEEHRKYKIEVTGLEICNGEGERIEIDMKKDVKND